jgi:hypothetical protein
MTLLEKNLATNLVRFPPPLKIASPKFGSKNV